MHSSTSIRLDGRTVLITGAGGGLGRGLAQVFAAAGANVVVTARRAATGDETLALIQGAGGKGLSIGLDCTQRNQVDAAVAQTLKHFGGLDIVIHNANASGDSAMVMALDDVTDDDWNRQAAVAWDGAFHLAQACFEPLKASGQGRFIMLGSAFGLHGAAMNPVYAGLKGGDRGFVKALAREWGEHGITVHGVQPSAATEPTEAFFAQNPAVRDQYFRNFSLRHMGDPLTEVAPAVIALCTPEFGYVTAQSIQVDGGLYTAL